MTEPSAADPIDSSPAESDRSPTPADGAQPGTEAPARVGQNELGRIEISARAVEKIAALAAVQVDDAGGVGGGLARSAAGAAYLRWRRTRVERLPKVSVDIDGTSAFLDIELSVRWPVSLAQVAEDVRRRVADELTELAGLEIRDINIQFVELVIADESVQVA